MDCIFFLPIGIWDRVRCMFGYLVILWPGEELLLWVLGWQSPRLSTRVAVAIDGALERTEGNWTSVQVCELLSSSCQWKVLLFAFVSRTSQEPPPPGAGDGEGRKWKENQAFGCYLRATGGTSLAGYKVETKWGFQFSVGFSDSNQPEGSPFVSPHAAAVTPELAGDGNGAVHAEPACALARVSPQITVPEPLPVFLV